MPVTTDINTLNMSISNDYWWVFYVKNNTRVRIRLEPYKFYRPVINQLLVPLSAIEDPMDNEAFSKVKDPVIHWTPIVMYLGRTKAKSLKFLVGNRFGYWYSNEMVELHPMDISHPKI